MIEHPQPRQICFWNNPNGNKIKVQIVDGSIIKIGGPVPLVDGVHVKQLEGPHAGDDAHVELSRLEPMK